MIQRVLKPFGFNWPAGSALPTPKKIPYSTRHTNRPGRPGELITYRWKANGKIVSPSGAGALVKSGTEFRMTVRMTAWLLSITIFARRNERADSLLRHDGYTYRVLEKNGVRPNSQGRDGGWLVVTPVIYGWSWGVSPSDGETYVPVGNENLQPDSALRPISPTCQKERRSLIFLPSLFFSFFFFFFFFCFVKIVSSLLEEIVDFCA